MELRLIEPGSFMMGPTNGRDSEKPVHEVKIPHAFYMGVHEVTLAQYVEITGKNPSDFKGPDQPVEMVSWDDAQEFCRKLSQREPDRSYRLPSEAEWEYDCRAGSTMSYYPIFGI